MTRLIVGPGLGQFSDRSVSLFAQLVGLVAERDGLVIHGSARPDYFRNIAERRAADLIAEWERHPRNPDTAIDRTLADMAANAADCLRARQAGRDHRAAMLAESLEPPSATVTLRLRDNATGKAVLVTLPRDAVTFA